MSLKDTYFIHPYKVGKERKSTAMRIPSAVIKSTKFDPETMFFMLKVIGPNSLHLEVINGKNIANQSMMPAHKFTRLPEQTSFGT